MRISEVIDSKMPFPIIEHDLGEMTEVSGPLLVTGRATIPDQFACRVLEFLDAARQALGIARVFAATAFLVDGGIELTDGRFLAIEIKYRMNWLKACQTGWQFGEFIRRAEADHYNAVGGIVFFEEFSGDWSTLHGGTKVERGWCNWYPQHATLAGHDGFRIELMRFRDGRLEPRPAVLG